MNIKDYLQDKYTFEEVILFDNWLDNKKVYNPDYFEQMLCDVMKNIDFKNLSEIHLSAKTLIIERLKSIVTDVQNSVNIL